MKRSAIIYLATFNIFLAKGYAQEHMNTDDNLNIQQPSMVSQHYQDADSKTVTYIKYYHVVETINMKFGGSITSYNVSDKSLIRTTDLGPNNTRVVTPKFGEKKIRNSNKKVVINDLKKPTANRPVAKRTNDRQIKVESNKTFPPKTRPTREERPIVVSTKNSKNDRLTFQNKSENSVRDISITKQNETNTKSTVDKVIAPSNDKKPLVEKTIAIATSNEKSADLKSVLQDNLAKPKSKTEIVENVAEVPANKDGYAYINIIKTYEKVAEKGYKSVAMFKKLGNNFYFNNEMGKAVRWYGELFAMEEKLDTEYYFRYATALKVVGQIEKSDNIMQQFNNLSKI